MTHKYTPTPCTWVEGDPDIFTHWNNKEVVLATVKPPVWHEDRICGSMEAAANAAHIVKCVNIHDVLIEDFISIAKQKLVKEISLDDYCNAAFEDAYDMMINVAREALKKAGAL